MKKILALILALVMCLGLCACGKSESEDAQKTKETAIQTPKLKGYFKSQDNVNYRFEIKECSAGDYGGEMIDMSNSAVLYAWYIEGGDVYINGQKKYYYNDDVLIDLDSEKDILLDEGDKLPDFSSFLPLYSTRQFKILELRDGGRAYYSRDENYYNKQSAFWVNGLGFYEVHSIDSKTKQLNAYDVSKTQIAWYIMEVDSNNILTIKDNYTDSICYKGYFYDGRLYDNHLERYQ